MPRSDYAICRGCGGHRDDVGPLSRHRLCAGCGESRLTENIVGMATMTNPARDRWRRGMLASVYPELLTQLQARS